MNIIRRFLLNLPFASKVSFLFGILAISLALLIVAIIGSLYHQRDSQGWAIHTEVVLLSVEQLQRYSIEIVGASRGYQLKPNSFFVDLIKDRKTKIEAELGRLSGLVGDNPAQHGAFAAIKAQVNALLKLVDTDKLVNRSENLAELNDLQSATLNDIRNQTEKFSQVEENLSTGRLKKLIASFKRSLVIVLVGSVVWFLTAFCLAVVFSKMTTSRLSLLRELMVKFADNPRTDAFEFVAEGRDEIGELAVGFKTLLLALEERARESETFVYSVSHDMRSPLVNLQGFSAELNLGLENLKSAISNKVTDPEILAELNQIISRDCIESSNYVSNATRRLAQIIDSLLQLSRAGRIEPKIENINLRKLVNEIALSLKGADYGKTAEFIIGSLPEIKSDFQALQQIFQNLLSNSVKYLSPDRTGEIEVMLSEQAESVTHHIITVRDNGRGIPKEFFGKLFMPFQRYHTDIKEGDGMGLAMVARLIRRIGGAISVSSEVGKFTEFIIQIPKIKDSQAAPDHTNKAAAHCLI